MAVVKAALPAFLCFAGLLFCSWHVHRNKHAATQYKVEITVYGPDGKVIPAARRR
jgi:hypothetical protein